MKKNTKLVDILLSNEEWQTFECKRAAVQPNRLLETVVAFANTDGGTVVVGLEDPSKAEGKNRLVGISENPDNVSEFLKLISKEIDPPIIILNHFEIEIENKQKKHDRLLLVRIEKSNEVHSLKKGDTFVRRGRQNFKIGATEILRLKYEKGTAKFENESSSVNDLTELNLQLLKRYKKDTNSENEDDWQFLKDNGLANKSSGKFFLTKAGILLFAKNPSVLLGNKCGVKIIRYYGNEPSYTGEPNFVQRPFTIEGPLIFQIEKTIAYFRDTVKSSPPKLKLGKFRPGLLIPEWVFQEAITNAIIHRNYFLQDDIQIRFFDDRIEVESPGTYPGHITVSNIRSERFSRNPIVQRTLNRFQDAPNLDIGEGVDRMFKTMKENNLYEPLFFPPKLRPNSVLLYLLNLQRVGYWDTVSNYLDSRFSITNCEARRITNVNDTLKMSRLLRTWVNKGLLEKVGGQFKGKTFYRKPGIELLSPFSKAIENGKKRRTK